MERYFCHLCNRIVTFGDYHTCYDIINIDYVYSLPQFEESQKTDTNQDDANNKFTENSSKNSANLIPEVSQKEKSEVSCMPASPKIQVSSLPDISNEECDTTLEERKWQSLNNDKERFMHFLDSVTEQGDSDNKIISETSNLNACSDFLSINKQPYNNNMIQEYRYERNSSELICETDDKIEEMSTDSSESMYSKKNEDAMPGPSEMRASKKSIRGAICSKKFNRKSNLNNKNKELVEDGKAVAGPSGIRAHKKMLRFHKNPKKFISKLKFKERNKTRTSDKSFMCDICKRQFSFKRSLIRHNRIHTGEKLYVCDICGKKCTHKTELDRHYRIHTGEKPFICNICKRPFAGKNDLTVHIRTHTGEKPFVCHICKRGFAVKYPLTVHIRSHTGEKPYKCSVCEMAFTNSGDCKRHKRNVHKHITDRNSVQLN